MGVVIAAAVAGCTDDGSGSETASAGEEGVPLTDAKFLIEHNATVNDTGFQVFVDGEPWSTLTVEGPGGKIVEINARGSLEKFGLTEGFLETNEPNAEDMSLEDVLALMPEGEYSFAAVSAEDGSIMRGSVDFTHSIPRGAEIVTPGEGATVDPGNVVVSWKPVTDSVTGTPVTILGYQVIVEKDVELPPSPSFFKSELSVFVSATTLSVTLPSEFLEASTDYKIEVLALEQSGNQTISERTFETP